MKKIIIGLLTFILCIPFVDASLKQEATLSKCVDGDTAWFVLNGKKIKARFLAIDTPESTNTIEEYGKEASYYTCDLLTNAQTIELEYDEASDKTDKYDRHLVWVFVDDELLQEKIVENGLGEVAYLYGNYKYTSKLNSAQVKAKEKKIGIWNNNSENENKEYFYVVIGIIILLIICIFSKKMRKKVIRTTKYKIKSTIKKAYKNL